MGLSNDRKSHGPGWQPPNQLETRGDLGWAEPRTLRDRAGHGNTCLGTTTRGLWGKGAGQKLTQTLGSQAKRKRRLRVARGGGMPAGTCPTGTGHLLVTWAALRTSGSLGWGRGCLDPAAGPEASRGKVGAAAGEARSR